MDADTTYKFIEQVHNNECLWNVTSKAYENKLLRDDLWNAIGVDFNMKGSDAYAHFRKLREKYRRETDKQEGRSGAAASKPSNWAFLKSLAFLDDAYKKRKVSNSQTWGQDEITCIELDDDQMESLEELPSTSQMVLQSPVPLQNRQSISRSRSKTPGSGNSIVDALKETTDKIVTAMQHESGNEGVLTFIRGTFKCLQDEQVASEFEEELMNVAMKYRFRKNN